MLLTGEGPKPTLSASYSRRIYDGGAVTHTARKTLVFDAGFDNGLTGTSTHWEAFAGLTYLLPHRLWKKW